MSRATPRMRGIAERLIAHEMNGSKAAGPKTPGAFLVCERLRPRLATLIGSTGFHALLSRARALGEAEVPWLRAVQVSPAGSLEGPLDLGKQVDPEKLAEAGVVLVAQLLGLLDAFIGESLTLRLVREVWPKLSLGALDFGKRDHENEKTN